MESENENEADVVVFAILENRRRESVTVIESKAHAFWYEG